MRRRRVWLAAAAALVLGALVLTRFTFLRNTEVPVGPVAPLGPLAPPAVGTAGPETAPIPAGPVLASKTATSGQELNKIRCDSKEQLAFHTHSHLAIFVNGVPRQVPLGIGIADAVTVGGPEGAFVATGTCFYWVHTHASDGIIHAESPTKRVFTLGDFFDLWGQPLGPNQLGSFTEAVTAFYNGQHFTGADPRDIPLTAHAQIQLDVGQPLVAPETINFGSL